MVICQIARKNRYPISFLRFTKLGFPMMILSLVISTRVHLLAILRVRKPRHGWALTGKQVPCFRMFLAEACSSKAAKDHASQQREAWHPATMGLAS